MLASITLFKPSRSRNWYVSFTDSDGNRKQKSTGKSTKREALGVLTEFQTLLKEKSKPILLSKQVEQFLEYARSNYPKKTFDVYRAALKQFQVICGDIALDKITAKQWDTYRIRRLEHVSPVSVNIELRTLKAFLNTVVRWGNLEHSPFNKQPFATVPESSPIFFTKEDFQKLLAVIKQAWLREAVVFTVLTGLRRGELINLRWQDVDLQRHIFTVQSNPTFKTKQGKKRTLPLNETAFHLLSLKHSQNIGDYVFTVRGKQIAEDWLSQLFKRSVRETSLNDKLHWHSLRSSFASWLVIDGVSIYAVSKLLGHSSVAITQKHYAHLATENLHNDVNKISVLFN
ncbi:MAG: tyrosine-type recombinase/integrase [Bacteroidota bacterium]|jgi:site-specific recombinase XerD